MKVKATGLEPHSHAGYEPGKRLYFNGFGTIAFTDVSYAWVDRSMIWLDQVRAVSLWLCVWTLCRPLLLVAFPAELYAAGRFLTFSFMI